MWLSPASSTTNRARAGSNSLFEASVLVFLSAANDGGNNGGGQHTDCKDVKACGYNVLDVV